MARAKRKPPAKPAAFISPHHRGHFCPVIRYPNTKPPPPTIHTPQKPHGPIKRHQPTPEHKKPAAAPNTAGRFHFFAPPRSLLLPSSDTRTQSPRRRRQYTPHKNLTARSNGTDRRPNTKKPAAASNAAGRFHFSAAPPSLLPPSSDTRTQSPRRRQYTPHKNLTARSNGTDRCPNTKKPAAAPNTAGRFHFSAAPPSLLPPSSDTRTQSPRRRQYTPHKNLTARSNGTDRCPNTKKPAAAPNTAGRFHFSAAPPSLLPPSSDTRTQKTRCRSEHRRPLSFLRTTAVTSAPSSDTRTQSPRRRQYTPHKNLTARSNGTDRYPNTKKPAAAPNTAGRFRFL